MNKTTSNEILKILNEVIKNPVSELNYHNHFELLIAVMLSAQTTDKRVNIVTKDLFLKYPTAKELMNASIIDVINIIKPVGLYENKAKNIIAASKMIYENYNNIVPNNLDELLKIPGVGKKTASVVLIEGFNIPAMPVDTHLYRMAKRLGYIKKDGTIDDAIKSYEKYIDKNEWKKAHHLFLLYGRYHCKSQNPDCNNCNLIKYCKHYK